AQAYVDFVNELIDRTSAKSHNLAQLAQTMNLVFGHEEEIFKNGDGNDYLDAQQAVIARAVDTIKSLNLNDGDVKFAAAIAYIAANSSGLNAQQVLNEFSIRTQIAADYQSYLENKELYDELIAADPDSAFAAGWATTFALAAQFGYTGDFDVIGDATDSVHIASSGNDFVNAEAGDDVVRTYAGDDTLHGGDGNDTLYGGSGNDSLSGEDGDDYLYGGGGDSTLHGGAGIDQFFIGQGNNVVNGGADEDVITFERNFADYTVEDFGNNQVTVTNNVTSAVTELVDVEFLLFKDTVRTYDPSYDNFIVGTIVDDLLSGTDLKDAINGFTGDDTIFGFDGDDFISGDAGDDQLFGGRGNDWIFGVLGNDLIVSGEGNDRANGGADGDFLWGESGNDTLEGKGGDDVLNGGTGNDAVFGGTGDDIVEGAEGADLIRGGGGDDNLYGGAGNDTLEGGNGDDEIHGGDSQDLVRAGHGDDVVYAGSGHDTIYASNGDDIVHAGDGNDQIFGSWGDDIVYGGDGNDKIFSLVRASSSSPFSYNPSTPDNAGAAFHYDDWGRDIAYGGAGHDQISLNSLGSIAFGGSGNDVIYAGRAQQRVDGGSGFDKVVTQSYNHKDVVWYKSASGTVGAALHDTWQGLSGGSLRTITSGDLDYSLYVNIERVQAKNGKYLDQGYSYQNGYGTAQYNNPTYAGFIHLSDEAFDDLFSEEAFLERRWSSIHEQYQPAGGGGTTQVLTVNPAWDTFDAQNNVISNGSIAYDLTGDQRVRAGGG
ncbi:MAG: calcium-binding protein, partial [Cyanobacteria bacterium J06576_12]